MEQDITKLELLNKELELELDMIKSKLKEKTAQEELAKIELKETRKQLDKILYSRSYKLICKIKKIIGRN